MDIIDSKRKVATILMAMLHSDQRKNFFILVISKIRE
jgi:hypothetical protein